MMMMLSRLCGCQHTRRRSAPHSISDLTPATPLNPVDPGLAEMSRRGLQRLPNEEP